MFQLLIQECHFSYPPKESESEWRSRAKYRSADHQFQKEKENSLRLECPDANGPGLLRAGPSGEERCTLHHTVLVSPQCPQEISLLTLPVFQGAAVSSERFSQSLPPRNVAELGGSPPLSGVFRAARSAVSCRSPASGHRASRSKYTRGQSRETGSLSRLFGCVETTAKCVVSMGHAHCRTRLLWHSAAASLGVTPMLVGSEQALVMEQEVSTL